MTDPAKSAGARAAAAVNFEAARRHYEERFRELEATLEATHALQAAETEAAARAEGVSVKDYQARRWQAYVDRRYLEERQYLSDPAGMAQGWLMVTVLAVPVCLVVGVIAAIVIGSLARSSEGVHRGLILGAIVGVASGQVSFFATWATLDRLAPVSGLVRRRGDDILGDALLVIFLLPPMLAVLLALLIS